MNDWREYQEVILEKEPTWKDRFWFWFQVFALLGSVPLVYVLAIAFLSLGK